MSNLTAISPLDGRYLEEVKELAPVFSESALMKYRLKVEVEHLIGLSDEPKIAEARKFTVEEKKKLRDIYGKFGEREALKVKKIEKTAKHDVKSIEYYLKEEIGKTKSLKGYSEFVHFALTSEDVNNLAYSLMLKEGLSLYGKVLEKLLTELKALAFKNRALAMLSLTHGQPATPTTLGKELAVFYLRLKTQFDNLKSLKLSGKLSGAVGNWNAHLVAYPKIDWTGFSRNFIESLGLAFNPLTTQIEPHDCSAAVYHNLVRLNNIVKNLDQDLWLYISRGVFRQKKVLGEVGSSTMPHKINPIYFENSEGNLGLANAVLEHLAAKLTISRLQRDLSDSTVIRNQGTALGYCLLALKSTLQGLARLEVDKQKLAAELKDRWELLAEPIQVVLRKEGYLKPYEALKSLTRGKSITKTDLHKFIRGLRISKQAKDRLLKLSPENYLGLAGKLVDKYLK